MTTTTITESGMAFGPFEKDQVFHIEQCNLYKNKGTYKIAEFLLYDYAKNDLKILEAKSSAPKPGSGDNFDVFIDEITQKLENTWHLWLAIKLNRHQNASKELSVLHCNIEPATVKVRFLLVINGFQSDWLDPIKQSLSKSLRKTNSIWNLETNPVIVLNDKLAKNHGLIQ